MIPIVIDFSPPQRNGYAKGGLHSKAEDVRKGGRDGDTVLIHVNPEELEWIKQKFGPGGINPNTGLHEFKPFWKQSWFAPVATLAANVVAPGIGSAIGSGLSSALGLGLSSGAASALGSGLIGGGLGALSGGVKGALLGGALGAVTPYALNSLGLTGQGGMLSGLNLGGTEGVFAEEAYKNAGMPTPPVRPESLGGSLTSGATPAAAAATPAATGLTSVLGGGSLMKMAPLLLMGAALSGSGQKKPTAQAQTPSDSNTTTHLSNVDFNRQQTNPNIDYLNYGYGPAASFFKNNQLPNTGVVTAAEGRYIRGGGTGTSDSIDAKLSNGEYVMDAQTVSMLGDGSSDAGAKKLDQMREEIRRHKGSALSKGKFAPNAKSPLSYVKGA